MSNKELRSDLRNLISRITEVIEGRKDLKLSSKTPLKFDDEYEQIRATFETMNVSHSYKDSGNYWLAAAYLTENLKYYQSAEDMGKCGHILIEIADCLFSCEENEISILSCEEAIPLLIRSRDQYSWTRRMAAVGELLLVAILLSRGSVKDALQAVRRVRSQLTVKEARILFGEDAHRVSRKLIKAYKTASREPLQQLERMSPKRKKTEEKNLLVFLEEWSNRYNAVRCSLQKLPSTKAGCGKSASYQQGSKGR